MYVWNSLDSSSDDDDDDVIIMCEICNSAPTTGYCKNCYCNACSACTVTHEHLKCDRCGPVCILCNTKMKTAYKCCMCHTNHCRQHTNWSKCPFNCVHAPIAPPTNLTETVMDYHVSKKYKDSNSILLWALTDNMLLYGNQNEKNKYAGTIQERLISNYYRRKDQLPQLIAIAKEYFGSCTTCLNVRISNNVVSCANCGSYQCADCENSRSKFIMTQCVGCSRSFCVKCKLIKCVCYGKYCYDCVRAGGICTHKSKHYMTKNPHFISGKN